ncbi:MAG: sigma-70 family RNA polymerase sigma factor [Planctomycetes bacterium]|nr:sigma-70 family RNA polymerase sigma factor [Planctomycetota bacterium]
MNQRPPTLIEESESSLSNESFDLGANAGDACDTDDDWLGPEFTRSVKALVEEFRPTIRGLAARVRRGVRREGFAGGIAAVRRLIEDQLDPEYGLVRHRTQRWAECEGIAEEDRDVFAAVSCVFVAIHVLGGAHDALTDTDGERLAETLGAIEAELPTPEDEGRRGFWRVVALDLRNALGGHGPLVSQVVERLGKVPTPRRTWADEARSEAVVQLLNSCFGRTEGERPKPFHEEFGDLVRKARNHEHGWSERGGLSLKEWRRRQSGLRVGVLDPDMGDAIRGGRRADPGGDLRSQSLLQALREAIEGLPGGLKEVALGLWEGRSPREIADALELSLRTAERRIAQVKERLGKDLAD